jgi:hypothetical protein
MFKLIPLLCTHVYSYVFSTVHPLRASSTSMFNHLPLLLSFRYGFIKSYYHNNMKMPQSINCNPMSFFNILIRLYVILSNTIRYEGIICLIQFLRNMGSSDGFTYITQTMSLLILFWPIKHLNVRNLSSYKVKFIYVMNIITINQSQTDTNLSNLECLVLSQVFITWTWATHAHSLSI